MSKSLSQDFAAEGRPADVMLGGKWEAVRIAAGVAYLVDPNGDRVARMGEVRARAIAAALSTPEGGAAYGRVVQVDDEKSAR